MKADITEKLNRLADLRDQMVVVNLRYDEIRDEILTPELRANLEAIEIEREDTLEFAKTGEEALIKDIKSLIVDHGETVKTNRIIAQYNKGRISWDTEKLAGYAVAHPQIMHFRKQGDPFTSIKNKPV